MLWAAVSPDRLTAEARQLILDSRRYFSAASIWELAIKAARHPDRLPIAIPRLRTGLLQNGYTELAITSLHTVATANLPPHHNDPFDRILISQATQEGLHLLTHDKRLSAYGEPVRYV